MAAINLKFQTIGSVIIEDQIGINMRISQESAEEMLMIQKEGKRLAVMFPDESIWAVSFDENPCYIKTTGLLGGNLHLPYLAKGLPVVYGKITG